MRIALLSIGVLLAIPMQSWSSSAENESLAPIPVDPQATMTIRYPGDDRPLIIWDGPPLKPDIPVVEGERVPIARLPDGTCPRVHVYLWTYPEAPASWFEEDGRHLWFPGTSSRTAERVDAERCEVIVDEAKSWITWKRVEVRPPDARVRRLLAEMGMEVPIDPAEPVP